MPSRFGIPIILRAATIACALFGATMAHAADPNACAAYKKAQGELIAAQKDLTSCLSAAKGQSDKCKAKGQRVIDLTKQLKGGVDAYCKPKPSITTKLGTDVDQAVDKSPKFRAKIKELLGKGYQFEYGPVSGGSYTDSDVVRKRIVIDGKYKGNLSEILKTLAHEAGHPGYTFKYTPPDGLTKAQYVEKNVIALLAGEGEATLMNFELRDDLKANGGEKIGIAGNYPKEYEAVYQQYLKDKDRAKARAAIAKIYGKNEHPSNDPSKTYWQYYAKTYEDYYDEWKKAHP